MRRKLRRLFRLGIPVVIVAAVATASADARPALHQARLAAPLASAARRSAPQKLLRVIVTGRSAAEAAKRFGTNVRRLGLGGAVSATVRAGRLSALKSDPGVSLVSVDAPVSFTAVGAVSASSLATLYPGRDAAANAWSAGATGRGVGIAVIDSGVTPSDAFGSRLVQVALDGQTGSLDDTVGHGTLVAGVAAGNSPDGRFIGIAPGATVYSININRPTGVHTSDVITALKWVFDNAHTHNIRVVNLSLSETVKSSYADSPLDLAIERLWASGVFVAVSAGNLGAGRVHRVEGADREGKGVVRGRVVDRA